MKFLFSFFALVLVELNSSIALSQASPMLRIETGGEVTCVQFVSTPNRMKCFGAAENLGLGLSLVNWSTYNNSLSVGVEKYPALKQAIVDNHYSNTLPRIRDGSYVGKAVNEMLSLPFTLLPDLEPIKDIFMGLRHTCVLYDSGEAICFGDNYQYQLGSRTTRKGSVGNSVREMLDLTFVIKPSSEKIKQLSLGAGFTCGLFSTGTVRCWGLGKVNLMDYVVAQDSEYQNDLKNAGLVNLPKNETVISISAGNFHACALYASGKATCWGIKNWHNGGFENENSWGPPLRFDVNFQALSFSEFQNFSLPNQEKFIQITSGGSHSCGLTIRNRIWCWGSNTFGQLGIEEKAEFINLKRYGKFPDVMSEKILPGFKNLISSSPEPYIHYYSRNPRLTKIVANEKILQITGSFDSTCILLESGVVKCWGNNVGRKLQIGTEEKIVGLRTGDMQKDLKVKFPTREKVLRLNKSLGKNFCALFESGQGICWSDNSFGATGSGKIPKFEEESYWLRNAFEKLIHENPTNLKNLPPLNFSELVNVQKLLGETYTIPNFSPMDEDNFIKATDTDHKRIKVSRCIAGCGGIEPTDQ